MPKEQPAIHDAASRQPGAAHRAWRQISAAGECVVVLKPQDMERLHVDMFDAKPCSWACWGVCLLPITPSSDALPRPQDPQILATRNPAEVADAIRGRIAVTFDETELDEVRHAAAAWIHLADMAVAPYHPFSTPFHMIQVVNRMTRDRHPRSLESLTPHDMVRMVSAAASGILVETHRSRAGQPISTPLRNLHVPNPPPGAMVIEIQQQPDGIAHRLALTGTGPTRSHLNFDCQEKRGWSDPLEACHAVAAAAKAEQAIGLFLPDPETALQQRRLGIGARLALAGLVPAWKGRRSIATALRLAHGRLALELHADGRLAMLGFTEEREMLVVQAKAHTVLVAEPTDSFLQVDRTFSYDSLAAADLETVRDTLIDVFTREINPRLPAPYRLAFTNSDTGATDRDGWAGIESLMSDFIAADPELAAAAPLRYSVILPEDPATGSVRLPRHGLIWQDRPARSAMHRFLVLANAAIHGHRSWGAEPAWNDRSPMALRVCGEARAPLELMGSARPPQSAHLAIEASLRVAAFWRRARAELPIDGWSSALPDGLPVAAGTVAALDALYLGDEEPANGVSDSRAA